MTCPRQRTQASEGPPHITLPCRTGLGASVNFLEAAFMRAWGMNTTAQCLGFRDEAQTVLRELWCVCRNQRTRKQSREHLEFSRSVLSFQMRNLQGMASNGSI